MSYQTIQLINIMKSLNLFQILGITYSLLFLLACSKPIEEEPIVQTIEDPIIVQEIPPGNGKSILVDATHDGGVWWYPQTRDFSPYIVHQGQALANYLRGLGFVVDELPRGIAITSTILSKYDLVIRAGKFMSYSAEELQAYEEYLARPTTLLLVGEFMRTGEKDELAEQIGISLTGMVKDTVNIFAEHAITKGISPFYYIAGSVLFNPKKMKILRYWPGCLMTQLLSIVIDEFLPPILPREVSPLWESCIIQMPKFSLSEILTVWKKCHSH